ncbi:MAG: exo-alpha-sialidase [Pirellulales bacterium]|nr:exo-alpha-sialidase [Pirellulales bacterium]
MSIQIISIIVGLLSVIGVDAGKGPANFEDHIIVPLSPNQVHRGITGSILKLKENSLLFAYSFSAEEPLSKRYPGGGIAARKSKDLGRTWSEASILQPRVGAGETIHPSLLRLPDGKILLAYDVQNLTTDDTNVGGDQHMYVRVSSDEGKTWSEQMSATHMPGICHTMPGKMVLLSTGRIILPVESSWPVDGNHFVSLCFYSDNNGSIWWPSKNHVEFDPDDKKHPEASEPSVVELADGRLIMICRTQRGYLARSYSQDMGLNWSKPELITDLHCSPSGFHVVRLPTTGDLLAIYCNNPHTVEWLEGTNKTKVDVAQLKNYPLGRVRAPLSTAISRDGGKTWHHHRNITNDPKGVYGDYGYPCVTFLDQGKILLINYHAIDGIHLARIGVNWFYGK